MHLLPGRAAFARYLAPWLEGVWAGSEVRAWEASAPPVLRAAFTAEASVAVFTAEALAADIGNA